MFSCNCGRRPAGHYHTKKPLFAVFHRRQVTAHFAATHRNDAVTQAKQLHVFRRDNQHCLAFFGQAVDQSVNLRLGADIDATCRFIEDDEITAGMEPFCEHHLLLVSSR